MEAKIKVRIKKIGGKTVDRKLLEKEPNLESVTRKTLKGLCDSIDKYFADFNIKTSTSFTLENDK